MSFGTDSTTIDCPYCGESYEPVLKSPKNLESAGRWDSWARRCAAGVAAPHQGVVGGRQFCAGCVIVRRNIQILLLALPCQPKTGKL